MPRSPAQKAKTQALYAQIVALNDSGLIDREIAAKVGCSVVTVERARRAAGLKKTPPYKGRASRLTAEGDAWLRENWQRCTDKMIAARFGVSASQVEKWRAARGLYYGHKGKWTRYPHPQGFAGGTHTADARAEIAKKARAAWANPKSTFNTREFRRRRGDAVSKAWPKRSKAEMYSRTKKGKREGLGDHHFRSRWEANYARYLEFLKSRGEIFKWDFEPDTFWFEKIRRGTRSYTPDFKVWATENSEPYFVEIKGWMDQKSKTKLKRMAKYYPQIRIELVGQKEYMALCRSIGRVVPGWEV